MLDPLPIFPFRQPVEARVQVPGSKSLTNRALILAALTRQKVQLTGALFSRDTRLMVAALQQLGFVVTADEAAATITLEGRGGDIPTAEAALHVGNAGTAARFLTAFLALRQGGLYDLDGDPAMRERPMEGLLEALAHQGVHFTWRGEPGYFPFRMETSGLRGGELLVDAAASSQMLSALLQVAGLAPAPTTVRLRGTTVSEPFVHMTVQLLRQFGIEVDDRQPGAYAFPARQLPRLPEERFPIEPDATAASYFAVLPLAVGMGLYPGGSVVLPGVHPGMVQGDVHFLEMAEALGLRLSQLPEGARLEFNGPARALDADFNAISDTFLTVAALAPLLPGPTRIRGIGHTRHQETDRVAAMATELRRLGQGVEETPDSLTIHPDRAALERIAQAGVTIHTYEDHRVAMSFGVLGCADMRGDGRPWLAVADPACTGKTFPRFFDLLEEIRPR